MWRRQEEKKGKEKRQPLLTPSFYQGGRTPSKRALCLARIEKRGGRNRELQRLSSLPKKKKKEGGGGRGKRRGHWFPLGVASLGKERAARVSFP